MKHLTLLVLFLTLSAKAVVFGVDDREAIRTGSPSYALSRSTAIAVLSANWKVVRDNRLELDVDKFDLMCSSERFATDPSLSYACSGFLVSPDTIVTAGHCMVNTGVSQHDTDIYCPVFSWLFDYNLDATGQINPKDLSADNLYKCKEVVFAVKDEKAPFRDYAIIKLDRKVVGRSPLKLAQRDLAPGELVSMIGYPLGTPAKRSAPASQLLNRASRQSFITSLDAFGGNSGSVVFNSKNEVTGILVGGTPVESFFQKPGTNCQVFNRCDQAGTSCSVPDEDVSLFPGYQRLGSEVQRISPVRALLKKLRIL